MQTTIAHGPEFFRFDSFEHWTATGHIIFRAHMSGPGYVVHVDARRRICTRTSHYTRARDEQTFPVVVYSIDEE